MAGGVAGVARKRVGEEREAATRADVGKREEGIERVLGSSCRGAESAEAVSEVEMSEAETHLHLDPPSRRLEAAWLAILAVRARCTPPRRRGRFARGRQ